MGSSGLSYICQRETQLGNITTHSAVVCPISARGRHSLAILQLTVQWFVLYLSEGDTAWQYYNSWRSGLSYICQRETQFGNITTHGAVVCPISVRGRHSLAILQLTAQWFVLYLSDGDTVWKYYNSRRSGLSYIFQRETQF